MGTRRKERDENGGPRYRLMASAVLGLHRPAWNPFWLLSWPSERKTNNKNNPLLSICESDLYTPSANIPITHRNITKLQTSPGQEP